METEAKLVTLSTLRDLWPYLIPEERAEAFRLVTREEAHSFFENLPAEDKATLLLSLPKEEARIWTRVLPPDDLTDALQAVEPEARESLLQLLDDSTRHEVMALLAYAEDQAGGLMNPRFARIRPDITCDVAVRYLRKQSRNQAETIYYVYVLDSQQRLLGVMSLREIFSAPPDALVRDVMAREPFSVPEDADQEFVARVMAEHDLLAVPVVDAEGRMRGIITFDDMVDVVEQEATEDIQKIGGVEALGAPYLNVGFTQMIRKRGLWLSVLFLGEMFTASAMGYFEHELAKALILASFIPLIISSGGNSGSQASTLVIRALALHELQLRDWVRVLLRELGSGATLGMALGFVGFLRVVLWHRLGFFDYGPYHVRIGLTVWASLLGIVAFGTFVGSMLPFLLRRLGLDPATSSAPFVATLVDVTGLVIYFGAAILILRGTLL